MFLPSCVIGGLCGLAIIQTAQLIHHPLPGTWTAEWSALPGFLINIVFACLFLGVVIPGLKTVWKRSASQLAYGQIVAWGQYVVGIGMVAFLLGPIFKLPALFAGILPVGFEGGHGTAAGMGPVFEQLGWAAGKDFALASATCGILSAIIIGIILINWAVRKGYTATHIKPVHLTSIDGVNTIPEAQRPIAGRLTVSSMAIDTLSLHIVIVAAAVGIGYLLKQGLIRTESLVPALEQHHLLSSFPLFPLCMIGGILIQLLIAKCDKSHIVDEGIMKRIQNTALDFLVVAAIATIKLQIVLSGIVPMLILVVCGIGWNIFCITILARRILPDAWFERSIAEMGQSMGVTATGLLLLRVADPEYRTPAAEAFGYKQLLHEPFMGGGLWTGMAIPLIAGVGMIPVFVISLVAIICWMIIALFLNRRAVR